MALSRGLGVAVAVAAAGAAVAHRGHVVNDAVRHETSAAVELLVMPSGESLRIASMGYAVHLADLFWVRTVLTFGERFSEDPNPDWQLWLTRMIEAVTTLDPQWRTPYFYGGTMLKVTGAVEGSNVIFEKGHAALPDDYFFPFAIGMNHYLGLGDAETAAVWVKRAAERPDAPGWYAAAARGFIVESSQRPVAIRFLREELALATDPELRAPLESKLRGLMYLELEDQFVTLAAAYQVRHGRPPSTPEDLIEPGGIAELPGDPLGGTWAIDVDGAIRSDVQIADLARRALARERYMLTTRDHAR